MMTRRKVKIAVATLAVAVAAAWLLRATLLRSAADLWILSDIPVQADAIVILGGGLRYRPYEAARLYHAGYAPKVLIAGVKPAPDERLGMAFSETERARRILLTNGVPESAIEVLGSDVFSTYDEAEAARLWVRQHAAKALLIPTELFHTRRVKWVFHEVVGKENPRFTPHVIAISPDEYAPHNWWQKEHGFIAFQNEFMKWCYYHCRY